MINHLALIMDGNRRWAKKQSLFPWLGHKQGAETVNQVIRYCLNNTITHLSLYTFSLENFKRTQKEQEYLFDLIIKTCNKFLKELINNSVKVLFVGDRNRFPLHVQTACKTLEEKTKLGTNLTVYILFCYGGRQETVAATKAVTRDVQAGVLELNDITENIFKKYLWSSIIPNADLIIRTGGFKRLSNFLPHQTAYSEFYFTDTLWPDLTIEELNQAILNFKKERRNFGV